VAERYWHRPANIRIFGAKSKKNGAVFVQEMPEDSKIHFVLYQKLFLLPGFSIVIIAFPQIQSCIFCNNPLILIDIPEKMRIFIYSKDNSLQNNEFRPACFYKNNLGFFLTVYNFEYLYGSSQRCVLDISCKCAVFQRYR